MCGKLLLLICIDTLRHTESLWNVINAILKKLVLWFRGQQVCHELEILTNDKKWVVHGRMFELPRLKGE